MLRPVKKDRNITNLPKCFSPAAALHTKGSFHPQVEEFCQVHRADTVNFNIAKVIVVGDVSVGKTCLINSFCKGDFDKNYKATIGVDFEMERFEVLGVPFSLQLWDTAGQERFKCIASTYYRGAQAIMVVFDLSSVTSLTHARQWLEDAMQDNDPSSVLLFLVGTKKDLSSPEQLAQIEEEAIRLSEEIRAEYWAVSAKSGGDGIRDFFFRVASLTFEATILSEIEKTGLRKAQDIISESSTVCVFLFCHCSI
uniref:RAB34, member RAS oncogene family b n=1 Tax=Cynoglossus semilaevis TaxID=244447 RepID=A0A3P8WS72_CYNSE